MASTTVPVDDPLALRCRNAELETVVRMLKEQLAAAHVGSSHIITVMGMQAAQAESASKQELKRALEENAFLRERLRELPSGRMAFLTNPNTSYDSTPNTELTSASLLENDADLHVFNNNVTTNRWFVGGSGGLAQCGELLVPETHDLVDLFDQETPENPVAGKPNLQETRPGDTVSITASTSAEEDDDLWDRGDSKARKARINAQGLNSYCGEYRPSALMARPAPARPVQMSRVQHREVPTRGALADQMYMRMMGAATFIEDKLEGLDDEGLVAYWEEYAHDKSGNYTGSAWRDFYQQHVRPKFLAKQRELQEQRAQEQPLAPGVIEANDEHVVLLDVDNVGPQQCPQTYKQSLQSVSESRTIIQVPDQDSMDMICTGEGSIRIGKGTSSGVQLSAQETDDFDDGGSASSVDHFPDLRIGDVVGRRVRPEDIELPTEDDDDFLEPSKNILSSAQGLESSKWAPAVAVPAPHLRPSSQGPSLQGSPEQLAAARAFKEGLTTGSARDRQREQRGCRTKFHDHCETSGEGMLTASRMHVQRFKPGNARQYDVARQPPSRPAGFYVPNSTDPNPRRTVLVTGIRAHTTLVEVIDQVREGPLYSAIFIETSAMKVSPPLGNTVVLEFVNGKEADAFAKRCVETPICLRGDSDPDSQHYSVPASLIPTPTRPRRFDVERALQDDRSSLSRTLFLRDRRCELTEDYVVDKLWQRNRSSPPLRVNVNGDGLMALEYASIEAAQKAWEIMSNCGEFNPLEKGFMRDSALGDGIVPVVSDKVKGDQGDQEVGGSEDDVQVGEVDEVEGEDGVDAEPEEVSEVARNGEMRKEAEVEAAVEVPIYGEVDLDDDL